MDLNDWIVGGRRTKLKSSTQGFIYQKTYDNMFSYLQFNGVLQRSTGFNGFSWC
jgi:hypothetical protein